MWQTVLEKSQVQQSQAINQIFYSKLYTLPQIIKQLDQNFQKLLPVFLKHSKFMLHIIFNHLSTQDCLLYMKNEQNSFIKVICSINSTNKKEIREQFSKFYNKFNIIQKNLVLLKSLAEYHFDNQSTDQLPWLLPDFIKTSASIIQKYLKLKSEAPKFETDYIQHGNTLVINTQNWVKDCYIKMISKLCPLTNKPFKNSILICLCDMLGALLELQQQKLISKQIIDQILFSVVSYCRKNFSIDEIYNNYNKSLIKNNFWIKAQKIFISDVYTNQKPLNKQGFGYLMLSYIESMIQSQIFKSQKIYQYLIPVVNQLAPFQYGFKQNIRKYIKIFNIINLTHVCNFPISVLIFNLYRNQDRNKEVYEIFFQNWINQDTLTVINSLIFLKSIPIQNLQAQKQHFILQILQKIQISQAHIILLRKIDFQSIKKEDQFERWMVIMRKVIHKFDLKAKSSLKKRFQNKNSQNIKKIIKLLEQ